MSSDEPFIPPKKKHSILWWIGGVLVLLAMLFVVQLFGPSPPIIVSPQTTRITEPLGPDGLPDYEQHVLELYRDGATPANNAVTLLWQALFPADVDPQQYAAMASELGLEQIPSADQALVKLHDRSNEQRVLNWLLEREGLQTNSPVVQADTGPIAGEGGYDDYYGNSEPVVQKFLEQCMNRPWTSEQLPLLAEWVGENEKPLDLIVEASQRPRYYAPSPTLLDRKPNLLIEMLLVHAQSTRDAARALSARAMWHLGEGRTHEAWQDLLAVHRLAVLMTQGRTLVEQLVAFAVRDTARDGTVTLLHHGHLTAEQARQIERALAALPDFDVIARALDEIERASALNAFIRVGAGGGAELFSAISGVQDNDFGNQVFNVVSVDWNLVLMETNRWYDRLVAAAELPDYQERAGAFDKIEADMQQLAADSRVPARWMAGVVSRQHRSSLVSSILLSLFLPAVTAAADSQDRANATLELTRLAAALAVYRAEHGSYPEKLEELVPSVMKKLPVDLYNAKPFMYKRDGDGYLLYNMGVNAADDGGSNDRMQIVEGRPLEGEDDAQTRTKQIKIINTDDISIRVPRPPLKLPKLNPPPQ
jgi:hypothetical protein